MNENEMQPDDDSLDNHRNAPKPDPACLHGLIGEVAIAGSTETEANAYAIAANFMAYMSTAVGRGPFMTIGNTWHHCRLFTLHVGRSGRGRKGDAVALVSRIDKALRTCDEYIAPHVHRGGLSSREGLIYLIHDGYTEGKKEIEPIHDKRLWVVESEFANVLAQGKRDGNTLSPALRDCWDGVSLKPATKSNHLAVTDPHVNVSAAITPGELLSLMATRDLTNGFANRFLPIWAERTKIIPFPEPTSQKVVDILAKKAIAVLKHCGAQSWVDKDNMCISLTPEAKRQYEGLYRGELNDNSAGDRITALIERRAPMLLRLAMLFALCDLKTEVDIPHIDAAMAWIRYSVDSVKFVFASAADEMRVAETNEMAKKIVAYLGVKSKATRKQITADCFQGHATKSRIDAALDELLSTNPPRIWVESIPRPKNSPGAATKVYYLVGANLANSANCEETCHLSCDIGKSELSESCELSQPGPCIVSSVSLVSESKNQPQTLVIFDSSHKSQSSPSEPKNDTDCEIF